MSNIAKRGHFAFPIFYEITETHRALSTAQPFVSWKPSPLPSQGPEIFCFLKVPCCLLQSNQLQRINGTLRLRSCPPGFSCPKTSSRGILSCMGPSAPNANDSEHLLDRAAAGDQEAWGNLLARHRPRLRNMISLRVPLAATSTVGAV